MNFYRAVLVAVCCLALASAAIAKEIIQVKFEKPRDAAEALIKSRLEKSDAVSSVFTFLDEFFRVEEQLVFTFGGKDGPLFDSEKREDIVPYFFIEEIELRFKKANYSESGVSVEDAVDDALMHTLFHEFAHAIIFMYDIPVVGKEEDAADALATVLLSEFFEDGQEVAISAADLFDLESEDAKVLEEQDFLGRA